MESCTDDDGEFPSQNTEDEPTLEFGWHPETTVLKGRRKKHEQKNKKRTKPGTFGAMGLSPQLYRNITHVCRFKLPTPIQRKTIPLISQGLDLVGMARTGSGKTAAFLVPILQKLKGHSATVGVRCLIVSPSRELSLQTYAVLTKLGKGMGFRTAVVVGGDSLSEQFMQLAANPDILLATPGRLIHLLKEVKDLSLKTVEVVVFDEADRLFETGFAEQIRQIAQSLSPDRQTLLFSATMPRLLAEFTKSGLNDPEVVRLDTDAVLPPDLTLQFFSVRQEEKAAALSYLLKRVIPSDSASIVFCATKHHVAFLSQLLRADGVQSAFVYGAMDQSARKIQVAKFRNSVVSVLFVTDVAARGVDLPMIDNVVHFDFPPTAKLFVHRSGRTARAGRPGRAYALLTHSDLPYLLDLGLFLSQRIAPAGDVTEDEATVFGSLPPGELALLSDVVQQRIHDSEELKDLNRSAENGFKLYTKTRPPASNASVRRAKELSAPSVHPAFVQAGQQTLLKETRNFNAALEAFRPTLSVFESEISQNKVPAAPLGGAELKLGAYKDQQFYIPYERSDRHVESGLSVHSKVDRAVMDLMGEDQEGLSHQRRQFHWDRRSRRYVCLPQGERIKSGKRIKMENGLKMTEGKGETGRTYTKWMQHQKTKIQAVGSEEDIRLTKRAAGALGNVGKRYREDKGDGGQEGEEMPRPEQLRKQKRLKAQQKWKNMPREKRARTRKAGRTKKSL